MSARVSEACFTSALPLLACRRCWLQSATAFSVVKYVGAAYLLYLGIRLLVAKAPVAAAAVSASGARRALLEGVLVEALNVKTALFFLAFLPQFLEGGTSPVPQLVVMGTVCVLLNTLVDVAAVLGAARLLQSGQAAQHRARILSKVSGDHSCRSGALCRGDEAGPLTPPWSGRPKACFAAFGPPLHVER